MRNALVYLALPLALLYLLGGSEALIDALSKIVILTGVQLITHHLNRGTEDPKVLGRDQRVRLKR